RHPPQDCAHVRVSDLAFDRRTDLTRHRVVLVHLPVVTDVVAVVIHDMSALEDVRQLLVPLVTQVRHKRLVQADLRPLHERVLPRRKERRQVPHVMLEVRPARRGVQSVRHVPASPLSGRLHRTVDLIQRQVVQGILLRRLAATARTLDTLRLEDVVQFALELHHEQRVTRPHTLRHGRESVEVAVPPLLHLLVRSLHTALTLTRLHDVLERTLRDRQSRARQALRLRDLDVALEFHRRVGRQPVLPLSDQVVPLLRQAVQVRALPLVARTLRPAVSDPSIQVLNLTTQVLDLLLSDTASLLELGPSLLRGHRLRLRPHLVDIIRRQVTASRDRQMLARRQHLVDQANRLIHQGLERQTSLAHVLHPLLPLRRVLSPVEKILLALSQRIPHGTRVGPDSVVDDRRVRLVPLLSNLRVLRGVRDLAIPNPELPLAPLSSRRLDHPVHRIERIRDVLPHVQRVVVSVQQRRRNELARVRVAPALVTQGLPQHRLATTNLLVASSGPSSRSTLLRLPGLNQSLLAQLNALDKFVPEIQVSLRGLVKRVQTLERRPAVSQVRLELLDLLRETH